MISKIKSAAKNILGLKRIDKINSSKDRLRVFFIGFIVKSRVLVVVDLMFKEQYYREHKAALEGIRNYKRAQYFNEWNRYLFRRNIHRLEKGLLMVPRRKSFASRFIIETVNQFKIMVMNDLKSLSEYDWGRDVLSSYFNVVDKRDSNVLQAYRTFSSLKVDVPEYNERVKIPYQRSERDLLSYDGFAELNLSRKSVRWFNDKIVDRDVIDKAAYIASQSPSSCNRSAYRYIVSTDDRNLTKAIADISMGTVGWSHSIPAIAVLIGNQGGFGTINNRHSIYVDSTLSVMPFILALEAMGLSTCLINWSDLAGRERKMSRLLKLNKDEKVILSIAIGYADETKLVAYSERKKVNEIVNYV